MQRTRQWANTVCLGRDPTHAADTTTWNAHRLADVIISKSRFFDSVAPTDRTLNMILIRVDWPFWHCDIWPGLVMSYLGVFSICTSGAHIRQCEVMHKELHKTGFLKKLSFIPLDSRLLLETSAQQDRWGDQEGRDDQAVIKEFS